VYNQFFETVSTTLIKISFMEGNAGLKEINLPDFITVCRISFVWMLLVVFILIELLLLLKF
jgi:hypothetical protein